jgi:hypothetical protein
MLYNPYTKMQKTKFAPNSDNRSSRGDSMLLLKLLPRRGLLPQIVLFCLRIVLFVLHECKSRGDSRLMFSKCFKRVVMIVPLKHTHTLTHTHIHTHTHKTTTNLNSETQTVCMETQNKKKINVIIDRCIVKHHVTLSSVVMPGLR